MAGVTHWRQRPRLAHLAVLAAVACCGCEGSGARVYSVTVLEPTTIECEAELLTSELDEEEMEALAKQERRRWRQEKERFPPTPEGSVLHVIEVESGLRAWFEPPGTGFGSATGNAGAVFLGDTQDNVIEAVHEVVVNTDEEDEENGFALCGTRRVRLGELLATESDGAVLGRINWQNINYIGSNTRQCAGTITCTRNVDVWGAEQR